MLKVDKRLVDEIATATHLLTTQNKVRNAKEQLRKTLHTAMRLEASTIPPYLVAAWSIQDAPGYQNDAIRKLIIGIAKEEMLHMMGVANIIAAMGEPPEIATPEIVLDWGVSKLPIGGDLVPRLAPFSMSMLTNLMMEIEKPENPIHYVVREATISKAVALQEHYATIGQFYEALIELINAFEDDPFKGGAGYPQIKMAFDRRIGVIDHAPVTDFRVTDKEHTILILNWIVGQGEGTSSDPMTPNGKPAHYYRFAEVYKGGRLTADDTEPLGYVYDRANKPLNCNFSKIHQFSPNPKMREFDSSSIQYRGLKRFNETYTRMFHKLQVFYDAKDEQEVPRSINSMNNMANYVDPLFRLDPPVCPSFEWIDGVDP